MTGVAIGPAAAIVDQAFGEATLVAGAGVVALLMSAAAADPFGAVLASVTGVAGVTGAPPPVSDLTAPDRALAAIDAPLLMELGTVVPGLIGVDDGVRIGAAAAIVDQPLGGDVCGKVDADLPADGAVQAEGAVRPRSAPSVPVTDIGFDDAAADQALGDGEATEVGERVVNGVPLGAEAVGL